MGKRVLVVEDDEFIGEVIVASLAEQGYTVDVAPNSKGMWEYLKRRRPSLILLDLSLPNEDGLMLCKNLRQIPATAKVPIVIVSAMSQAPIIKAAIDAGADDFIKKPFDIDELAIAARKYTHRRSAVAAHRATVLPAPFSPAV
ncbi:MAG: response regulator [Chloroflexi bacterium]|nr:response regulator [Chloroflexota bacterium]